MKQQIRYDYSFMMKEAVGAYGTDDEEIVSTVERLRAIRTSRFGQNSSLGFMRLPYASESIAEVSMIAEKTKAMFKTLLVLGIGGSDLGARAVISALPSSGMRVLFLGANTDPCEINAVVSGIDWNSTAVNVISKSGDTIETMSTFLYVRDCLIQAVGESDHARHIIATTDVSSGTLRTIADKEHYQTLIVPNDVGGRFSVLSPVGLFPIACAGIPIDQLCQGAAEYCAGLLSTGPDRLSGCEYFAVLHYLAFTRRHQNIQVFIPYAAALAKMGFWFRQLWAESLGKKDTTAGKTVYTGPTPIAALGATDQHSQFQLYYFGPFDKVITFVDVEEFGCDLHVPDAFSEIEGVSYMKGLSFSKILRTELQATSLALVERGRPNGRIILPKISAYYVGQLIQFLEVATVYMGDLLEIDPFDQPGVELGKQNMYALFDRRGYESRRSELTEMMSKYKERIA